MRNNRNIKAEAFIGKPIQEIVSDAPSNWGGWQGGLVEMERP